MNDEEFEEFDYLEKYLSNNDIEFEEWIMIYDRILYYELGQDYENLLINYKNYYERYILEYEN